MSVEADSEMVVRKTERQRVMARARGLVSLRIMTAVAPLVLAAIYASLGYQNPTFDLRAPVEHAHLLLNLFCFYVVAIFAWRVHGQLDHKLAQTIMAAVVTFGIFALVILGGRLFFSRGVLLTAFTSACLFGAIVVALKHRLAGPRVCTIAPLTTGHSRRFGQVVTDPQADLRGYDIVLVSLGESVSADWARALSRAMLTGAKVRHIGEYEEEIRGAVSLEHFELDHVSGSSITSYRTLKRIIDVGSVVFFLPVVIPTIILLGLAILLSMGRPIFFVQERVGVAGRPFRMWKLRTMRNAKREDAAALETQVGDVRVTFLGRILRRFRLDELPQFWNVLAGDMSLIGPRPEAVPFHDAYVQATPAWAYRNLVRPGITGWAQVCTTPSSNAEEARRKLTFDLYYVKRLSLFLDLKIALKTLWTIATGAGVR